MDCQAAWGLLWRTDTFASSLESCIWEVVRPRSPVPRPFPNPAKPQALFFGDIAAPTLSTEQTFGLHLALLSFLRTQGRKLPSSNQRTTSSTDRAPILPEFCLPSWDFRPQQQGRDLISLSLDPDLTERQISFRQTLSRSGSSPGVALLTSHTFSGHCRAADSHQELPRVGCWVRTHTESSRLVRRMS
jgi:hypothetical protein